jgi:hypothetical protein
MAFIIPAPLSAPEPAWGPAVTETPTPEAAIPEVGPGIKSPLPGVEQPPELLHIPCPQGHELEVPPEMLNQDVLCPHCGTQFRLRAKDSVEHKRKREEEEEKRIAKAGKLWFNWAIALAVVIVLFLIVLMIIGGST